MKLILKYILAIAIFLALTEAQKEPHFKDNRSTIVHLFEWTWLDIAKECEDFLGPQGYGGVQISAPNEVREIDGNPWWARYQPVSYILISKSGSEQDLADMIKRCNKVGVRIYVDTVINHMTGYADGDSVGTAGSVVNYGARHYPTVPYGPNDFHPACDIHDYQNAFEVRNCQLSSLVDLNQTVPHVREMIVNYMNKLVDMGVAGFRIDAAKHMWPEDLAAIYGDLKDLNKDFDFPDNARPYIYQEVIDLGGESIKKTEYNQLGAVTEFKFSNEIGRLFRNKNSLKYMRNWGPDWYMLPSEDVIVFVDNHDNQRGHGAGGADILTYKQPQLYKLAITFMLAHPYGKVTRVMSSYDFTNTDQGPPRTEEGSIRAPEFLENNLCNTEAVGWVCEHRWPKISQMVKFRNFVGEEPLENWWEEGENQIAFSRGKLGFVAFNMEEEKELKSLLQTGLSHGIYCDILSGSKQGNDCTGLRVEVDDWGFANIQLSQGPQALAIYNEAKLDCCGTVHSSKMFCFPLEMKKIFEIFLLVFCFTNKFGVYGQKDPHFMGNRFSIVHLFEWTWRDIAKECEDFLGPQGYGGVQISPPNEVREIEGKPWWARYQPVSYILISRSGNQADLINMIERCSKVGVRIYVDIVVNHMTGLDEGESIGTAGSHCNYKKRSYPAVPYGSEDFHPACDIKDYQNSAEVRNCQLNSLLDLNQTVPHVRNMIVDYMNKLLDLGVAGFRLDAAKHMWPNDLKIIYGRLKPLSERFGFPKNSWPYIFQEVIDLGGESIKKTEYSPLGAVTEFKFSTEIGKLFRGKNSLKFLKTWGPAWELLPSQDAIVFVDNHDNQRGHGAGGADILSFKDPELYKMAVVFMLSHPYGKVTRIMSSYAFTNTDQGPPTDNKGNIKPPTFLKNNLCDTAASGWVCEHRWPEIHQMVKFRNIVGAQELQHWWEQGENQIAFSRGSLGFVVFNMEKDKELKATIQTGLRPGVYCDILTGSKQNNNCSGDKIVVAADGKTNVNLSRGPKALAVHEGSKL
ncbi:uncharacterized protein ACRADG_010965 [Cochliomyia hominivorax]